MDEQLRVALVYAAALDQLVATTLTEDERGDGTDGAVPLLYAMNLGALFVPLAVLTLPFSRADPLDGENLNERLGDLPDSTAETAMQIRLGPNLLVHAKHLLEVFRLWESRVDFTPIYSADALEAVLNEIAVQASHAVVATLDVGTGEVGPITVH